MYLLDTNTYIQFLNGKSQSVSDRLRMHTPSQLKLCSIVKAEMLYGAAKSSRPERTRLLLEGFFSHYESFPFDDRAAYHYGLIRHELAAAGTPIGPNDLLIASIALSHQLTLVTHNTREFSRVTGLGIEDWENNPTIIKA